MDTATMAGQVSEEQIDFFKEHGYLILQDVLCPDEVTNLQIWAQEVHDWPITPGVPYMPYEV